MDYLESLPCPALRRGEDPYMNRRMSALLGKEEALLLAGSVTPGETKTVMIGGAPYGAELSPEGVFLLFARKEREAEEDAVPANTAASLRSALTSAVAVASALRRGTDPVSRRYAGILSRSVDQIVRISDNLRTASLKSWDAMHTENLAAVLKEIADQINYYLGKEDAVILETEPGDPSLICSRELIASLVMNLTVEALLASEETVTLRLRPGKTFAMDFLTASGEGRREFFEKMLFEEDGCGTGFASIRKAVALHEGSLFLLEEGEKLVIHVALSRSLRPGADAFAPESVYQGGDYVYMMLSPLKSRRER